MSKSNAKILPFLVILSLLGLVAKFSLNYLNNPDKLLLKPALLAVDHKKIQSFEILHFTKGLRFSKDENGFWWVKEKLTNLQKQLLTPSQKIELKPQQKADFEKVAEFFTSFFLTSRGEAISQNTHSQKFQINPQSLQVIFFDQNQNVLEHIFIGKLASDLKSTYIKYKDKPGIYLAERDMRSLALKTYENWQEPSKK